MTMTPIRTLAVVTALTFAAAACGGDDDTSTASSDGAAVATLADDAATDDTTDTTSEGGSAEAPDDPELAYARYDECMAEYGFDFSTSFGGDDTSSGIVVEDTTLDLDDPQAQTFDGADDFDQQFDEANADCEKHLANVDDGFDLSPEQQALFEDAQLEWAACMRDAGIDIPDLDSDGGGAIAFEVGADESDPQAGELGGVDFDFEAFEEAAAACEGAFDELNDVLGDEAEG